MDFSSELHYSEGDSHRGENASIGCCPPHSSDPTARGPNLAQVYGQRVQLASGSYTFVDDAFLRDSILNPTMHVTAGYAPIMPTYQGQISEEGLIDLVEYIKTLHSNYRVQQTLNTSQVQNQVQQQAAPSAPGMVKQ